MNPTNTGAHIPSIDSYFDVTHSFKVGSSIYHVLGLRKDFPNYKNTYYLFQCDCDQTRRTTKSTESGLVSSVQKSSVKKETSTSNKILSEHYSELEKKIKEHVDNKQESIIETYRTENNRLFESIRSEMKSTMDLLSEQRAEHSKIRSKFDHIESVLLRQIEENQTIMKQTYEEKTKTILLSIDNLKRKLSEAIDAKHRQTVDFEKIQLTLNETIERSLFKFRKDFVDIDWSVNLKSSSMEELKQTMIELIQTIIKNKDEKFFKHIDHLLSEQRSALSEFYEEKSRIILNEIKSTRMSHDEKFNEINVKLSKIEDSTRMESLIDRLLNRRNQSLVEQIEKIIQTSRFEQETRTTLEIKHGSIYQPFDSADENCRLLKISLLANESAKIYADLYLDHVKQTDSRYTLCQRDPDRKEVIDCFVSPPVSSKDLELRIYASTRSNDQYQATILLKIPSIDKVSNSSLPKIFESFTEHNCILLQPFQSIVKKNSKVSLEMFIPQASRIRIKNGNEDLFPNKNQYSDDFLQIELIVQGDLIVFGRWETNQDEAICAFTIDKN